MALMLLRRVLGLRLRPKRSGVVVGVFTLGLLGRLALLYVTRDTTLMIVDERHYQQLAHNLLHGYGFAWNPGGLTSIRPPLYPLFLMGVWSLAGVESPIVIRALQILLSLFTAYLVCQCGMRLFDRRTALIAAGSFWLYPSFMGFNFFLLTEILFTCLLTLVALGYIMVLHIRRYSFAFGTGCALGLAALTRSVLWPFPLLLCPLVGVAVRGSWQVRTRLALSLFVGYVIVIAPWAIRNTRLQGVLTIVDTMGGLNLLMGNYEHTPLYRAWDAVSLTGSQAWFYHLPATPPDGMAWTEGRKEKWATRQAVEYIIAHPTLTLKRALVKFASFWGLERVIIAGWFKGMYHVPQWCVLLGSGAITLAYVSTMLLGSLGLCLAPPENRSAHVFIVCLILFICGMHTVVFGHERYHLPLIPFFLLYAGAAVRRQSWRRLRAGERTVVAPLLLWAGLLAIWGWEILVVESESVRGLMHFGGT